jgi:hypothetical protein
MADASGLAGPLVGWQQRHCEVSVRTLTPTPWNAGAGGMSRGWLDWPILA